jgi:tryptophan 2,3-dioxygenase
MHLIGIRLDRREAVFLFGQPLLHLADNPTAPAFVRYWSNSGHAWHCFVSCVELLPVDQAVPLWRAAHAQAAEFLGRQVLGLAGSSSGHS